MENIGIIQLISEILVALLLLYIAFFKSYFQEKGKNLATKEDIESITQKVESIKSDLQFSLEAGLSWRAEEHDALVDYYSKYGAWIAGITNISMVGISDDNIDRLSEIRSELDELEEAFDSAESRMELFVNNENILSQKGPLKRKTIELQAHAQKKTFEFSIHFLEVKQMKITTPPDKLVDSYREYLEKENDMYAKFKEEQIENYKEIYPLIADHRNSISNHLRELIKLSGHEINSGT